MDPEPHRDHFARRASVAAAALVVLASVGALVAVRRPAPGAPAARTPSPVSPLPRSLRPNLLFVNSDDQRSDTLEVMPKTLRWFNLRFDNAFVTTPLCCPSRASALTGLYEHHTHVSINNHDAFQPLEPESLGPWLQSLGYRTGFVGKYFNALNRDVKVPQGWDEFHALVWDNVGHDIGDRYTTFVLREAWTDNGGSKRQRLVAYPNRRFPAAYSTDVFAALAVQFLERAARDRAAGDDRPWALLVWPNAPNGRTPAARHADAPLPPWDPPPSFLETDMSDKPAEVTDGRYVRDTRAFHERIRGVQLRMVMGVDDLVDRVFERIEDDGAIDSTWAVYTSDNGRLWGEHRLWQKLLAYEEGVRVPFLMRVPGETRRRFDEIVANIDIAPTLVDLAGDPRDHGFDGRSLVPLVTGRSGRWRTALLLEHEGRAERYTAVRTSRWKLIRWTDSGHEELYDLRADPYELANVAVSNPAEVERLVRLMGELRRSGTPRPVPVPTP